MKLPKLFAMAATIATVGCACWSIGAERGYERGRKTKGAEFQVMLDANVYWAHRNALSEIATLDSAWAIKRELRSLDDYYDRVISAKGTDVSSTIKLNYIDQVEQHHQEHRERFQAALKELEERSSASVKPAEIQPADGR
ncbi:MAG: hypothetical protein EOP83_03675 [Verrucomicrobiaceae bacterium]|nr:MAG: hypothetical protein EOP83_03675 [Verrucomicrobiaceae bacterium]